MTDEPHQVDDQHTTKSLVDQLESGELSPWVAGAYLSELRQNARDPVPLQRMLADKTKDPEARAVCANILGLWQVGGAAAQLASALADDSECDVVIGAAAEALGRLQVCGATSKLLALLERPEGEPLIDPITGLGRGSVVHRGALLGLVHNRDGSPAVVLGIAKLLHRENPHAVFALAALGCDPEPTVVQALLDAALNQTEDRRLVFVGVGAGIPGDGLLSVAAVLARREPHFFEVTPDHHEPTGHRRLDAFRFALSEQPSLEERLAQLATAGPAQEAVRELLVMLGRPLRSQIEAWVESLQAPETRTGAQSALLRCSARLEPFVPRLAALLEQDGEIADSVAEVLASIPEARLQSAVRARLAVLRPEVSDTTPNRDAELLRAVDSEGDRNFVVSPSSVWRVLGIVAQSLSAGGALDTLHPWRDDDLQWKGNDSFQAASRVFVDERIPAPMRPCEGVESERVPFSDAPGKAAARISQWIAKQSSRLPVSVDIPPLCRGLVVDVAYFAARWRKQFAVADTSDHPFEKLDGAATVVPMMKASMECGYAETPSWQAVELPYEGGEFGFLVLLPAFGRFNYVKRRLSPTLYGALDKLSSEYVGVAIPRFRVETNALLNGALEALGVGPLSPSFLPPLVEGEEEHLVLLQTTFIDVTERGTEAGAVTKLYHIGSAGPRITFTADRPFFFFLRHLRSQSVLFAGQYTGPAQGLLEQVRANSERVVESRQSSR